MVKKRKPWAYWSFNTASFLFAVYLFFYGLPKLPGLLLTKGARLEEKWLLQHSTANVVQFYAIAYPIFTAMNFFMVIFMLFLGFQYHLLRRALEGEIVPKNIKERLKFISKDKAYWVFVLVVALVAVVFAYLLTAGVSGLSSISLTSKRSLVWQVHLLYSLFSQLVFQLFVIGFFCTYFILVRVVGLSMKMRELESLAGEKARK